MTKIAVGKPGKVFFLGGKGGSNKVNARGPSPSHIFREGRGGREKKGEGRRKKGGPRVFILFAQSSSPVCVCSSA